MTGSGSAPGRGKQLHDLPGGHRPQWYCRAALLGPIPAACGGRRSGLVPRGCITAAQYRPRQQQLLPKDCLCRSGRLCLCPAAASAPGRQSWRRAWLQGARRGQPCQQLCRSLVLTHTCWKQLLSPPPGLISTALQPHPRLVSTCRSTGVSAWPCPGETPFPVDMKLCRGETEAQQTDRYG